MLWQVYATYDFFEILFLDIVALKSIVAHLKQKIKIKISNNTLLYAPGKQKTLMKNLNDFQK